MAQSTGRYQFQYC